MPSGWRCACARWGISATDTGFASRCTEDVLDLPRTWKAPRRIFVNSMSDLFHADVPLWFIRRVFQTMEECPQHTFQVLTKRSDRVQQLSAKFSWPQNVWMGTSVEDSRVLQRIDDLRGVPAAVRFLSCEPLIGSLAGLDLRGIHWVIVGGESGPHARPMQSEWVREIFRACRKQRVPFFFKQWGGVQKILRGDCSADALTTRCHSAWLPERPLKDDFIGRLLPSTRWRLAIRRCLARSLTTAPGSSGICNHWPLEQTPPEQEGL